ncbi:MAG: hypothetical protein IKQ97_02540 [Eubacterium sp.]|nr:hypothetical protein [Eubacterium sp.]
MNWFRRLMTGRYGRMDQLNICLFIVFIALAVVRFIIGIVVRITGSGLALAGVQNRVISIVYAVLFGVQMAAALITILRMFSRNIPQRQKENQKFMEKLSGLRHRGDFRRKRKQARSEGKELLRCPVCRKVVRVPLGRGKIEITCPNCKARFVRKT